MEAAPSECGRTGAGAAGAGKATDSAALTEKGTRLDRKQLGKILAKLERAGAVETAAGKYICQNETILHYPTTYSESQLLDIIGMTQNTVNGQAVFSGVPPMSISSRGSSGV